MIIYVQFTVELHGLQLATLAQVELLKERLRQHILTMPLERRLGGFDIDICVELIEHAGTEEQPEP